MQVVPPPLEVVPPPVQRRLIAGSAEAAASLGLAAGSRLACSRALELQNSGGDSLTHMSPISKLRCTPWFRQLGVKGLVLRFPTGSLMSAAQVSEWHG